MFLLRGGKQTILNYVMKMQRIIGDISTSWMGKEFGMN